ncbi:MAG: hypothetical protein M1335_07800, partial [Chloroflexi bacterium]|nr:hypothetical protein [Chloroflexota bacterium]
MRPLALVCSLAAGLAFGGDEAPRPISYSDLPQAARLALGREGVSAAGFPAFLRSIEKRTRERLIEGENDHLVFFVLQSSTFSTRPRIEPALSASEFVAGLPPGQREAYLSGGAPISGANIPRPVLERIADLLNAKGSGELLSYFKRMLRRQAPNHPRQYLCSEYVRAMRFLYVKEFAQNKREGSLYRRRGHSSDTQVEANFAVWTALSVVKAVDPLARLDRVLIVGPGLDFAPRTDFFDMFPPQSYQPFAIADALLGLALTMPGRMRIHCVDINPRVVEWIRHFPSRK